MYRVITRNGQEGLSCFDGCASDRKLILGTPVLSKDDCNAVRELAHRFDRTFVATERLHDAWFFTLKEEVEAYGRIQVITFSVRYRGEQRELKRKILSDLCLIDRLSGGKIEKIETIAGGRPFYHGVTSIYYDNSVLVRYAFAETKQDEQYEWRLYSERAEGNYCSETDRAELIPAGLLEKTVILQKREELASNVLPKEGQTVSDEEAEVYVPLDRYVEYVLAADKMTDDTV